MSSNDDVLRTLLIVVAAILLLPFLTMVLLMPIVGMWGMGHMWDGTGATWAWLLLWLVLVLVVGGIGYLLYRAIARPAGRETDPALQELRSAYARGDLSDEEFEQRRNRLRQEQ